MLFPIGLEGSMLSTLKPIWSRAGRSIPEPRKSVICQGMTASVTFPSEEIVIGITPGFFQFDKIENGAGKTPRFRPVARRAIQNG